VLHPLRLRILRELGEPDSATGLARRLGLPRQQVNYHLRLLEDEGLVEAVEERQRRGCTERLLRSVAASYLINPATLGDLAADPRHVRDRASSAYLVAVAARTLREVASLRQRAGARAQRVPTLSLESDVRFASAESQRDFAQELTEAVAGLVAKYHDEEAAGGRWFRVTASAYPTPVGTASHSAQERN
jgi:DNA-binding transcriptional ArsR family regulator